MVVTTYLYNAIIKSPYVPGEVHYRIPLRVVEDKVMADLRPDPVDPLDIAMVEAVSERDALTETEAVAEAAKRKEEESNRLLLEQMKAQTAEKLKKADDARRSAEGLITQARLDADTLRNEARVLAQEEGERIAAESKSAGFAEGYQEGIEKAEAEGELIRAMAQDVLRQAEESRRQHIRSLEESLIELSVEIAEKMIAAQLILEPETVTNIAKEALTMLENRALIVLYVNPAELPLYENKMEDLKSLLPLRAELQLFTDASIQTGGCRIETESGTVDTTLETRRNAIIAALYGE